MYLIVSMLTTILLTDRNCNNFVLVCNQLFEPENTFLFCDNDTVTDTINCTLICYPGFGFDHDPKDFYLCGPDTLHQWDIQTVENPLARLPSCTGEHISAYISKDITIN